MKGITTSRLTKPLIGLAIIAGLSVGQVANAALIDASTTDKTFNAWGLNWTAVFDTFAPSNGNVSHDASGVTITGDNSAGGYSSTEIWGDAPVAGSVIFDWSYTTADANGAGNDPLFYIEGTTFTPFDLSVSCTTFPCTGTTGPVAVTAGLFSFGLSIDSVTGQDGLASVDISNLNFLDADGKPIGAVPVPAAFWLFGTALAGFGFMRKKKAAV